MPRKSNNGASAGSRRTSTSTRSTSASSRTRFNTSSTRTSSRATSTRKASSPARPRAKAKTKSPFSFAFGRWWVLPTSFALGLALFAWGYYPVAAVQYRQTRERQQLAAELKTLQARNHRLRDQVERLKTPEGVEDYARSQLGLVKQGEHAVRVVDGDEASEMSKTVAAPTIDSDETPKSDADAWTAFLDLVFGFR